MWKTITHLWDDFVHLLYPNLCLACELKTPPQEALTCVQCQYLLPKTNFHLDKENAFTERFWGRMPLEAGAALYHFTKGGRTQKLIHNLKYNGKKDIGIKLGELYGEQLKASDHFKNAELIVPVPLHPRKEKIRGYNQSDAFAIGLSTSLGIPWMKDVLIRVEYTETQTKKSRAERLENVRRAFQIKKQSELIGRHVLLIDDVLTTGATLEACGEKILTIPNTKLSLATIAIAKY